MKEISDWNWYGFSASYSVVNIIDLVIQFALAGVVIAWIYKREMRVPRRQRARSEKEALTPAEHRSDA